MLKFVNLHSHTNGSIHDGISPYKDHANFCLENGMSSMAVTEHGNMNTVCYQVEYSKEQAKKGIEFKPIYGAEFYYVPSISDWHKLKTVLGDEKILKREETSFASENAEESKNNKSQLRERFHLLLLAKNEKGLTNLFKLVSASHKDENFYFYPRIDLEMIKEHSEGLICTSGCLISMAKEAGIWADDFNEKIYKTTLSRNLQRFRDIFGEDYYLELQWNKLPQQHIHNKILMEIAKQQNYELITTVDSHYPRPDMWRAKALYGLLGKQAKKWDTGEKLPNSVEELSGEYYPKNGDQVWESYKKYTDLLETSSWFDDEIVKQAIENSFNLSEKKIKFFYPDTSIKMPSFVRNKSDNPDDLVRNHCEKAFEEKKKLFTQSEEIYRARLEKELEVIFKYEFSDYFLTSKMIVDFAIENAMITSPGRGSSCGSLVSWFLGITQIDPIRWGLHFERFLAVPDGPKSNSVGFPDVDQDYSDPAELKRLLAEKYGEFSVIPISNFNRYKPKSLIKDVAKLFEIPYDEVNEVTKKMEEEAIGPAKKENGMEFGAYEPTFDELVKYSKTLQNFFKKYPEVSELLPQVLNNNSTIGCHAGGVCILENLNEVMPIIKTKKGFQTPWPEGQHSRQLEPLGFLKFDILGVESLEMIKGCITRIIKTTDSKKLNEFYNKYLHPDVMNFEDEKVWKNVFDESKYVGIFQFTNEPVQKFATNAKPRNLQELSAITSVFRPGGLCLSGQSQILKTNGRDENGKRWTNSKTLEELYEQFEKVKQRKLNKRNGGELYTTTLNEEDFSFSRGKIKNVYKCGVKPVYSIITQVRGSSSNKIRKSDVRSGTSNNIIKSTLEHRFLTPKGWKQLSELVEGDYIASFNTGANVDENRGRKDRKLLWGERNFKNLAFYKYQYKCVFCDWDKGSLDVNHIDGNRKVNNQPDNLCFMCPNHHRQFTEGTITREQTLEARKEHELFFSEDIRFVRYIGKEYVGDEETYDIEMSGPNHNFVAGGFIVHNSNSVDKHYLEAKENPQNIKYLHPDLEKILGETYGFCIYQEQIAGIANILGKDISLYEGSTLRKLLTKKGLSESKMKEKDKIHVKFVEGCLEKGLSNKVADEQWENLERWNGYGFNKCLGGETLIETKNGNKKIVDVVVGDFINSKNGFVEVKDKLEQGKKKCWKIKTKSGKEIVATLDHKFETPTGMKTLREILKSGDKIIVKE